MDTVGYAVHAGQMDRVTARCRQLAQPAVRRIETSLRWSESATLTAAVCPHDDYWYAGRLYELLLRWIRAKTVVLFGVNHHAGRFGIRDTLVFDAYRCWHGPYGPVPVSNLRRDLLDRLPPEDFRIDNAVQVLEHSVEGIVSYLQSLRRDVEIVSILVPMMDISTLDSLSARLAGVFADILRDRHWIPGRDIAFVCSCDGVHYGDSGWGGSGYAPYGTDARGYDKAVEADVTLAENTLCGPLHPDRLGKFLEACADPSDPGRYRMTWCGRFSVTLGLKTVFRIAESLGTLPVTGHLLDYGTSVSEESLDLDNPGGLGPTAPNNFHHWVGYPAIGYL